MKKTLVKVSILGFALLAIALIPGNSKFVFGYGSPTFAGSSTEPPVCDKEKPAQVVLYEPNHPLLPKAVNAYDVRLNWLKADKANKYTLAFGLSSGNYIYGLPNVGNTDHFTVGSLTPGQKYYFVVRGVNECMPGLWSREWAVRIGGGTGGVFTNLNTNSPRVITPPNIPSTLPRAGTPPRNLPVTSIPQAGGIPFTPPLPTPTPQQGFFQGVWHGFLGIFGG